MDSGKYFYFMKRLIIVFFLLLIIVANKNISFAQTDNPVISINITPTPELRKVEYQLPYPGLLPDNKLYFTKVIRDRLISFLISDPLKKAEFALLVADKRLAAGFYLAEKGNFKLAEVTISKGENYFEEAIAKTKEAKKQGMDINLIANKISEASIKHGEVIKSIGEKSPKELKLGFINLEKKVEGFEKEVNLITPK